MRDFGWFEMLCVMAILFLLAMFPLAWQQHQDANQWTDTIKGIGRSK